MIVKINRILFFCCFFSFNIMVILRIIGITFFIGINDIFWVTFVCAIIAWGILIHKTKKIAFAILSICTYAFIFYLAIFRVGGFLNSTVHTTKIISSSSNNSVIVKEFDRPVHSCCAIYKKCFLNVYYMVYINDIETNYYPFYENSGFYEWIDEDIIQLSFPYSKDSDKYKTFTINFD